MVESVVEAENEQAPLNYEVDARGVASIVLNRPEPL